VFNPPLSPMAASATLAEQARAFRKLGVVTNAFGLGDHYPEGLLAHLADAGGGGFQDIADAASIPVTIGRYVEELCSVVSAHAHLDLSWEGDLKTIRVAAAFHAALREQAGAFEEVIFAVTDWSPERKFLPPFATEFNAQP
jgi:hypothetical protein